MSQSVSTTTRTVNGVTTTTTTRNGVKSVIVNGKELYNQGNIYVNGDIDSSYNSKEISQSFPISDQVPIFIESGNRNIEIRTWDQPKVKITATFFYKDDADSNLSFDKIMEKSNIAIKSSDNAFQILGSNQISSSWNYPNTDFPVFKDTIFKNRMAENIHFKTDSIVKANLQWTKTQKQIPLKKLKTNTAKLQELALKLKKITKKGADVSASEQNEIAEINKELATISTEIAKESQNEAAIALSGVDFSFPKENIAIAQGISSSAGNNHSFVFASATPSTVGQKRHWVIYIPENHRLNIESKYGNIKILNDVNSLKIDSKYGNVEALNIQKLTLQSSYGNFNAGNIDSANIDIRNGRIKTDNINHLAIESKYSDIDLNNVNWGAINSINDNYDINNLNSLSGNKKYGNLRIESLNNTLKLSGENADLKVRSIAPAASSIQLDNKYANISLPMTGISDYSVQLDGKFNTSYDDFVKTSDSSDNNSFQAKKGNGNGLKISINCTSCTLDFK